MSQPAQLASARLRYDRLQAADADDVLAVYGDPATWRHLPAGRYASRDRAAAMIDRSEASWETAGLGDWAVRSTADLGSLPSGTFLGTVGMTWTDLGDGLSAWNLGYRFTPASWGLGVATEAARTALAAVAASGSEDPVTARALTANPASIRVLGRVGLTLAWRGATATVDGSAHPAPATLPATVTTERVVYADRPLPPDLLAALVALG
ncbi:MULTISPECIES: GNAT family N-acetyltransferase [Mumia]|uniref:GNAT family N-acetyltransferase n=1 Tax=Mumia xiangluensis TaxID=1678900 RepID=A0ABW1QRE6_9ACTN|nr:MULTISPECIES: GNAT family N-acetyltransferase [Mumia]